MARITKVRQQEIIDALEELRKATADIDVIYTDVTHVARSGMMRTIRPFIVTDDRRPRDLTWLIVKAGIGKSSPTHGGVVMGGAGMDMGFALVYEIGRAVIGIQPWACRGERCGSNEHVNPPRVPRGSDVIHIGDSGYRFRKETL